MTTTTSSLTDRVAIVTGGTRGIGLAIAAQLLAEGARVVVASRKADVVEATVAELSAGGAACVGVAANVADPADRERLVAQAIETFGRIDAVVNNAAANPVYGPVEKTEPWAFEKIMAVNVAAPFELAKLALPHLRASDLASVLNVSSIGGLRPEPGLGIYSVSKTALNGLTRVLAREWGRYGIRVNAICPGLIQTDFSEALWSNDKLVAQMQRHTPLGRIGQPAEIGKLAAAILGDAFGYATGQTFTVDGGYTV